MDGDEEAAVLLLGCVLKCNFLREAFALGVFAHDVRAGSPIGWKVGGTPSRSNSVMGFKVSMMLFRSVVILDKLIVGEPDARVSGDIAHVAFGKMLGHESVLSCISPK